MWCASFFQHPGKKRVLRTCFIGLKKHLCLFLPASALLTAHSTFKCPCCKRFVHRRGMRLSMLDNAAAVLCAVRCDIKSQIRPSGGSSPNNSCPLRRKLKVVYRVVEVELGTVDLRSCGRPRSRTETGVKCNEHLHSWNFWTSKSQQSKF